MVWLCLAQASVLAQASADEQTAEMNNLEERLKKLESKLKPQKIKQPNKDIDYLYDIVFGYKSVMVDKGKDIDCAADFDGAGAAKKILYREAKLDNIDGEFTYIDENNLEIKRISSWLAGDAPLRNWLSSQCKLHLVERELGLTASPDGQPAATDDGTGDSTTPLVSRIDRSYNALGYNEWEYDHTRFGLMLHRVNDIDGTATSLVIHVFPSYRRYTDGRIDLLRRTSLFAGVGTLDAERSDKEVNGAVYSLGLSTDIVKGFALTYGFSRYSVKSPDGKKEEENSFTFGVSLMSEFWSSLFQTQ